MIVHPQFSTVRIYKQRENKDDEIEIVGAGFLVSEEYLVTCAHVVNQSLGLKATSSDKPTQIIECDFAGIRAGREYTLETTVEMWKPVQFKSNDPQDIAVLKLNNKELKPPEAQPLRLICHQNSTIENSTIAGDKFEAFGFSTDEGIWAEGEIKKGVAYNQRQIEGKTVTGERLQGGFSGTAIWDKDLQGVVGIAAIEHDNPDTKIAFFIPVYMLFKAFPDLYNLDGININGCIPEIIILLRNNYSDFEKELNLAYQNLLSEVGFKLVGFSLPQKISLSNLIEVVELLAGKPLKLTDQLELEVSLLQILIGYFVLEIKPGESHREKLKEWLEKYVNDWKTLLGVLEVKRQSKIERLSEEKENISQTKEPCLLVSITEENNSFRLKAWIVEDLNHYGSNQESPQKRNYCKSLKSNEEILIKKEEKMDQQFFVHYLKEVYQEAFNLCQCLIKKIQFFFPYKLIEKEIEPVDSLKIDDKPSFAPPPMGTKYEIMVRFSERLKIQDVLNPESFIWQQKCDKLKDKKGEIVAQIQEICKFSNSDPAELYKEIMPEHIIGARLEILRQSDRENVMEAFYCAGIPLAIWVREDENFNCQETLENICNQCQLENLPVHLKEKRRADWGQTKNIGNYLSLLWDDYKLVPPNHLLKMS